MIVWRMAILLLLTGLCATAWGFDSAQLRLMTDEELVRQVRVHACTEAELNALLPELQHRFPAFDDRVQALARLYEGAPYVHDPLTDETADWFPWRATNCTLFVLSVEALANSRCVAEARQHMRLLHYRGGRVGFADRYHFTEDRITDPANRYFAEATAEYVRDTKALARIALELNRCRDGSFLFGDRLGAWTRKVTLAYIARAGFTPDIFAPLPRVMGIAFIKKQNCEKGLAVGHEGLIIDGDLWHASPGRGVVVEKNYFKRTFAGSPWEGMFLFRLMPQNFSAETPCRQP